MAGATSAIGSTDAASTCADSSALASVVTTGSSSVFAASANTGCSVSTGAGETTSATGSIVVDSSVSDAGASTSASVAATGGSTTVSGVGVGSTATGSMTAGFSAKIDRSSSLNALDETSIGSGAASGSLEAGANRGCVGSGPRISTVAEAKFFSAKGVGISLSLKSISCSSEPFDWLAKRFGGSCETISCSAMGMVSSEIDGSGEARIERGIRPTATVIGRRTRAIFSCGTTKSTGSAMRESKSMRRHRSVRGQTKYWSGITATRLRRLTVISLSLDGVGGAADVGRGSSAAGMGLAMFAARGCGGGVASSMDGRADVISADAASTSAVGAFGSTMATVSSMPMVFSTVGVSVMSSMRLGNCANSGVSRSTSVWC